MQSERIPDTARKSRSWLKQPCRVFINRLGFFCAVQFRMLVAKQETGTHISRMRSQIRARATSCGCRISSQWRWKRKVYAYESESSNGAFVYTNAYFALQNACWKPPQILSDLHNFGTGLKRTSFISGNNEAFEGFVNLLKRRWTDQDMGCIEFEIHETGFFAPYSKE